MVGPFFSGVQCYLLSWLIRVIAHLGRVLIRVWVFVWGKRSNKRIYIMLLFHWHIFFFISNFLEKII